MKKFYKLLFICLLILSGGMALKAQNVDDTFSIKSKEDLITFADLVENNKSLNARLYADIDLEGGYWNTICETALYYNSYSNDYGYSGTFDGNGHVIKNGTGRTFGKTRAFPHIAPVNDWVQEELPKRVERKLK